MKAKKFIVIRDILKKEAEWLYDPSKAEDVVLKYGTVVYECLLPFLKK